MRRINEDRIYKIYVTDALKIIAENTAKFGGGSVLRSRYYDLISEEIEAEPEETAEEIINRIKNKLGKLGGEE